jgi:hypothetical protein
MLKPEHVCCPALADVNARVSAAEMASAFMGDS